MTHTIDQYAFWKTKEEELVEARANYDALTVNMSDEQKILLERYVSWRIEQMLRLDGTYDTLFSID